MAIASACTDRCRPGPRGWWRAGRCLAAGLLLLIVAPACTTGLVYQRMDWVVSWYVSGFVTLSDRQDEQLRAVVRKTMAWHRETQLPRYVGLLEELAANADAPVSAEQLEARYQQVSGYLDDFLRQVIPDVAPLLRTLSAAQLDELQENLEEDNQDLWDELAGATPEKRQARRNRTAVRSLQRFVGRLSSEQRVLLESGLSEMRDLSESWLDRRRHWQERFVGVLRAPPPGPRLAVVLEDLALNPDQFDAPDYRRGVEHNRRVIMRMLAGVSAGLSERQQQHLHRKFLELAADLQRISEMG